MDPVSAQISQMSDSSDSEEPTVDRVLADAIDLGGRKKKKTQKAQDAEKSKQPKAVWNPLLVTQLLESYKATIENSGQVCDGTGLKGYQWNYLSKNFHESKAVRSAALNFEKTQLQSQFSAVKKRYGHFS